MSFWRRLLGRKAGKRGFVLALGGGGGRGLAHLGVFEELERHGLRPDVIVGTSIGALFGAMYALNPDAAAVRRRALEVIASENFADLRLPVVQEADAQDEGWLARLVAAARQTALFTRAATDRAVADSVMLREIVGMLTDGKRFADAKIPLYVTAVRFPSGECHVFSSARDVGLGDAVAASMAIPGVFDPVEIEGEKFVDGGVASELPAREARMVARKGQCVVAVNVGARPREDVEPRHVYGMLDWASQIKSLYLRRYEKEHADVLIEPMVGFTQWHDFSRPEQEIERGRQAALEAMPALIRRLGR
ncbi:MAG: patatin-like phospholipase family protein [Mariprofundaceae bacterium]